MMRVRLSLVAATSLAIIFPASAWATNGYFSHGTSTAEKALAGAGAAFSQDTLAAANNPAGMVWQGNGYDIGAALFAPMREYSSKGGPAVAAGGTCPGPGQCPFSIGDGDQSIDSENESFLIPSFGYNWMLGDDSSIGVSVYGNGGMNTEYKGGSALFENPGSPGTTIPVASPGTYGDGTAGVDLAQMFISTTYASKLSETSSWGISGIIAYQRFEAQGIGTFAGFSTDPSNLSDNDHDTSTGIGLRIGYQAEISPGFRFGAAYQPKIDMSEFDDYSGLFAEDGDFDIPSNFTIGVSVDVGENSTIVADIQRINYEDVASVSNPIANLVPSNGDCAPGPTGGTGDGCLGGSDGAGFGWENMTVFKLGYQMQKGANTWRFGYSKGDQPIPSTEVLFNILAPGVIEEHLTFGFTRQLGKQSTIDFAAMYALSNTVDGTNTFDPTQEIELEMDQYELVVSYSRRM